MPAPDEGGPLDGPTHERTSQPVSLLAETEIAKSPLQILRLRQIGTQSVTARMAALFARSSCGTQTDLPPRTILVRLGQGVTRSVLPWQRRPKAATACPWCAFAKGPSRRWRFRLWHRALRARRNSPSEERCADNRDCSRSGRFPPKALDAGREQSSVFRSPSCI